jgi:hypothetical protein
VVALTAPELAADQLVAAAELAQIAGVGASTLRAYLARGENDVPLPQATVAGRSLWSRPVAQEYAEARRQDPDAIAATMSAAHRGVDLPRGIVQLWQRFNRSFLYELWENPTIRPRWARRWRTEPAIREVAEQLGWTVAADLDHIVPMSQLGATIRYAILGDLAGQLANHQAIRGDGEPEFHHYGMIPALGVMITWYIRHDPALAHAVLGETIGQAEHELKIPRHAVVAALHTAVDLDGNTSEDESEGFRDFFDRLLPEQEL